MISSDQFAAALEPLGPFESEPVLAVGVSGGVDSLTLLALTLAWCRARNGRVVALCVDHGLRATAAAEARRVVAQATLWGAEAEVLTRADRPSATAVQEEARRFRHAALEAACRRRGILHMLLGHHGDDQAETVLARLAHGSGPEGMAAMAPVTIRPGVRILRPLLGVSKADLMATARQHGLTWDEDPSNQDPRFERVRWRAAQPALTEAGLSPLALGAVARRAGVARARAGRQAAQLAVRLVVEAGPGWVRLERAAVAAPERRWEIAHAVAGMVASLGGSAWSPDIEAVAAVVGALPLPGRATTLGGCVWRAEGRKRLLLSRECRGLERRPLPLPSSQAVVWDGRWRIRCDAPGRAVVALGPRGAARLAQDPIFGAVPSDARAAWPVVIEGGDPACDDSASPSPPSSPTTRRIVALADPGNRSFGGSLAQRGDGWIPASGIEMVPLPRLPLVPVGLRVEGGLRPSYIQR